MIRSKSSKLEDLSREELLTRARRILAEADALSTRISAVNEIGVAMSRTLDLDAILKVIGRQSKWLLDFEHCSVCLVKDEDLQVVKLFGEEEPIVKDLSTTENVGQAIQSKHPQLVSEGSPSPFLKQYNSQIIIPLSADDVCLGTINFASTESNCYTYDDMRIGYMLALQLSSAIRNANIIAELRSTQNELHLRIEELDAYAHTIAHDLKSPLSNILLTGEILGMKYPDEIPPDAMNRIQSMVTSGKQMHTMIDQLLWLARLRNPQDAITSIPIRPIAYMAVSRFTQVLEERQIKITVMEDNPPVLGHAQWLEEVLANLISNAIKYMGENNPNPSIEIKSFVQGDRVRVEVIDTGVGIKDEDKTRLFDMFTRLYSVNAEGIGLGLSIVRRIINKLDGEIGVESTFGEGSTFWFTLKQGNISWKNSGQ